MFNGYLDRSDVAQVGCLEREATVGGKSTVEVQYLITSVPPPQAGAATLLGWLRGRWGIENRLHYVVRDVTLGEDANQTRVGSGPQVLAALRNLAISKLRLDAATNAAALRRNAARVGCLIESLRRLKQ